MILLVVWTLLALPGTVLNAPMFIIASILSRKKAKGELITQLKEVYHAQLI
jgi:glycerol-3-phosphate O-acyltransferase/dihydroxyacetone phosphate acyltransferase